MESIRVEVSRTQCGWVTVNVADLVGDASIEDVQISSPAARPPSVTFTATIDSYDILRGISEDDVEDWEDTGDGMNVASVALS